VRTNQPWLSIFSRGPCAHAAINDGNAPVRFCSSDCSFGRLAVFKQQQQHPKHTPTNSLSQFANVVEEPRPEKTPSNGATAQTMEGTEQGSGETAFAVTAHNTVEAPLAAATAPAVLDDAVQGAPCSPQCRAAADDGDAVVEARERAEQEVAKPPPPRWNCMPWGGHTIPVDAVAMERGATALQTRKRPCSSRRSQATVEKAQQLPQPRLFLTRVTGQVHRGDFSGGNKTHACCGGMRGGG
jgi:hypothetical protein